MQTPARWRRYSRDCFEPLSLVLLVQFQLVRAGTLVVPRGVWRNLWAAAARGKLVSRHTELWSLGDQGEYRGSHNLSKWSFPALLVPALLCGGGQRWDPSRGHSCCSRCLPPACPVLRPGSAEVGNGLPCAGGGWSHAASLLA